MSRLTRFLILAAFLCAVAVPALAQTTLPVGAEISVILNETVNSKDAKLGQIVGGTVASDVTQDGKTVIPKGAKATLKVVNVQSAGRVTGQPKLWLRLVSIQKGGRTYTVTSNPNGQNGASRGKRTAIGAGGGAAAGAVIGAIAGGGKGAAIGAAVGAGAGTAGAAATGETEVEFPAESTMNFSLKTALTIR